MRLMSLLKITKASNNKVRLILMFDNLRIPWLNPRIEELMANEKINKQSKQLKTNPYSDSEIKLIPPSTCLIPKATALTTPNTVVIMTNKSINFEARGFDNLGTSWLN